MRLPAPIALILAIAALSGAVAGTARAAAEADFEKGEVPGMLPDRRLDCTVGHVTNFDPAHEQTADELRFDSHHRFSFFLARGRRMTGAPPETFEAAPKVDPRTRIIADPDGVSGQNGPGFGRLVDKWPYRVELSTPIDDKGLLSAIALHPIDEAKGTAWVLMLRASELTHFDAAHIYQGTCKVLTGKAATAAARRPVRRG